MTIWVRNWKGKYVRSLDNYAFILRIDLWLAYQRWYQLLLTPKHIVLGAWYGYTSTEIWWFVKIHITLILEKPHK